jgi:hypothetical protein
MLRVLVLSGLFATSLVSVATAAPQTPNLGPSRPFSRLFGGEVKPSPAAPLFTPKPLAPAEGQRRKTVCGMPILVPEPVDPEMVRHPKDGVTYTMRFVPPPACSSK